MNFKKSEAMGNLTVYEIYKKAKKEKLTKEQYKQLLIDNNIIISIPNKNVRKSNK